MIFNVCIMNESKKTLSNSQSFYNFDLKYKFPD